jgi:hypothetical protein
MAEALNVAGSHERIGNNCEESGGCDPEFLIRPASNKEQSLCQASMQGD